MPKKIDLQMIANCVQIQMASVLLHAKNAQHINPIAAPAASITITSTTTVATAAVPLLAAQRIAAATATITFAPDASHASQVAAADSQDFFWQQVSGFILNDAEATKSSSSFVIARPLLNPIFLLSACHAAFVLFSI